MRQGKDAVLSRTGFALIAGIAALVLGLLVLGLLPLTSSSKERDGKQGDDPVGKIVNDTVDKVDKTVKETTDQVEKVTNEVTGGGGGSGDQPAQSPHPPGQGSDSGSQPQRSAAAVPGRRATTQDPETDPPLHGSNPHGQGTVGVVDLTPSNERPLAGDPTGAESGEEIVLGRSRGEQNGKDYRGRITILSTFLTGELIGVETDEGEEENGPLQPLQDALDQVCTGSAGSLCLSLLTADSRTTGSGSFNSFQAAGVVVGGPTGVTASVGNSEGNISEKGGCQTSESSSSVADVGVLGVVNASAADSQSTSKACRGGKTEQTNSSSVIGLNGTGLGIPNAGCADGTPDSVTEILGVATVVCNADDRNQGQADDPNGTRESLSVFVLPVLVTPLTKASTANSESAARAPSGGGGGGDDDDGNGDGDDNGDGSDPAALVAAAAPGAGGDVPLGTGDPIAPAPANPGPGGPGGPNDDGPGGPQRLDEELPFTGADVLSMMIAGLMLVAVGSLLRRRMAER